MTKYALIINGTVDTVSHEENSGWPEVPDTVFRGDIDNGDGTFSRPTAPEPTPEELRAAMPPLTARQFLLGMIHAGVTETEVVAELDKIADPIDKAIAKVEWERAGQFERTHHLVVSLSATLGLTADQLDALWSFASDL